MEWLPLQPEAPADMRAALAGTRVIRVRAGAGGGGGGV